MSLFETQQDTNKKLIIAGGRNFTNYELLKRICTSLVSELSVEVEIVSGGAKGVDKLGERFSKEVLIKLPVIFEANWDKYGKAAGMIRNRQMAEYGDVLIAFWDYKSNGTRDMIKVADNKGLKVFVFDYEGKLR